MFAAEIHLCFSFSGAFYGYAYYRALTGNLTLEVESTGHHGYQKWPKRQQSRHWHCFRSIRQVAAPLVCPLNCHQQGAYCFAA